MPIYATTTTTTHANAMTMATIAGPTDITLGATTPAHLAKTKPQVTKTRPPTPT